MTTPLNYSYPPSQPPPPAKKKTDKAKVILLSAFAVIVGFVFLGSCVNLLSGDDSTSAVPSTTVTVIETETETVEEPTEEATTVAPKPKPKPKQTTFGDGSYLVGKEIPTGTWKAAEVPDGMFAFCSASTENKDGDTLEWETGGRGESVIIRIRKGAYTFESSGCGTWKKVG